jgi:excisionase family DNA binding protein
VRTNKSKVERPPLKAEPEFTVKEVAALMRVDIDFVYDLAAKGELVVHRYGARCVRIPGWSLRAYQRRCQSVDIEPEETVSTGQYH